MTRAFLSSATETAFITFVLVALYVLISLCLKDFHRPTGWSPPLSSPRLRKTAAPEPSPVPSSPLSSVQTDADLRAFWDDRIREAYALEPGLDAHLPGTGFAFTPFVCCRSNGTCFKAVPPSSASFCTFESPDPDPEAALPLPWKLSQVAFLSQGPDSTLLLDFPRSGLFQRRNHLFPCRTTELTSRSFEPGVTFFFTDGWRRPENLGHLARDLRSLSRLAYFSRGNVSRALLECRGAYSPTAISHLENAASTFNVTLEFSRGSDRPASVCASSAEPFSRPSAGPDPEPRCFRLVAQKLANMADFEPSRLEREAAYARCGILSDLPASFLTVLHRNGTRVFDASASFQRELVQFFSEMAAAHGLQAQHASFDNASFCKQVRITASTKVWIAVHGQATEGNSLFARPGAVLIELFPRTWTAALRVGSSPSAPQEYLRGMHVSTFLRPTGIRYIAADVLKFSTWGCFFESDRSWETAWLYSPDCRLAIDFRALGLVLNEVLAFVS